MPAHGLLFRSVGIDDRLVLDSIFPLGIFPALLHGAALREQNNNWMAVSNSQFYRSLCVFLAPIEFLRTTGLGGVPVVISKQNRRGGFEDDCPEEQLKLFWPMIAKPVDGGWLRYCLRHGAFLFRVGRKPDGLETVRMGIRRYCAKPRNFRRLAATKELTGGQRQFGESFWLPGLTGRPSQVSAS
jgi:hypothetical protein